MTLNQLIYFCEVCENCNMSQAAEVLHVSQPSISVAVHELEEEFGVPLFYRRKGRLSLTEEGQTIWERTKIFLAQYDLYKKQCKDFVRKERKILLGTTVQIGASVAVPLYKRYLEEADSCPIEIWEGTSPDIQRMILHEEVDIAVMVIDKIDKDLFNTTLIMESPILYCVSKDHALAGMKKVSWNLLKNEKLMLSHVDENPIRKILNEHFSEANVEPQIFLRSDQVLVQRQCISENLATGFLIGEYVAMKDNFDIVGIEMEPPVSCRIGFVWKKGKRLHSEAHYFMEFGLDCYKKA